VKLVLEDGEHDGSDGTPESVDFIVGYLIARPPRRTSFRASAFHPKQTVVSSGFDSVAECPLSTQRGHCHVF
jgi:hypothetical protein